jgi:hypothetical protein
MVIEFSLFEISEVLEKRYCRGQQVAEMDAIVEWILDESLQGLQPIALTCH